jgi:hypothetical protein
MLLDAREPGASDEPHPDGDLARGTIGRASEVAAAGVRALPVAVIAGKGRGLVRYLRGLPLGLIGFGLSGLLAKGLELDLWPWTFLIALSIGLALIALGYRLSRVRPVDPAIRS